MAGLIDRFDDPVSWTDGYCSGFDAGIAWARDQMDLALARAIDPGPAVPAAHRHMIRQRQATDVVRRLARVMDRPLP
jgi:hypothetical protein